MVDWSACPGVESVPGKVSGNWVFKDTRLPLYVLFENLAAGATIHDFIEWFDGADEEKVAAVLEYVAQELRAKSEHSLPAEYVQPADCRGCADADGVASHTKAHRSDPRCA